MSSLTEKRCGKCGIVKISIEFRTMKGKTATQSSYLCSMCKSCERVMALDRHNANKEHNLARSRQYKIDNAESIRVQRKLYLERTRDHVRARYKLYCETNRAKMAEIANDYRRANPGTRIRNALRVRLLTCIQKSKGTELYLGTQISVVKRWIEWNWHQDMNWENYGRLWNIDHTLPVKLFDMDNDADVLVCFNWKNLMPYYKRYNISKSNKILPIRVWFQESRLRAFSKLESISEDMDEFIQTYSYYFSKFLNDRYATLSN